MNTLPPALIPQTLNSISVLLLTVAVWTCLQPQRHWRWILAAVVVDTSAIIFLQIQRRVMTMVELAGQLDIIRQMHIGSAILGYLLMLSWLTIALRDRQRAQPRVITMLTVVSFAATVRLFAFLTSWML